MLYHLLSVWSAGRHYAYENVLFRGTCAALFCFLFTLFLLPCVIRQLAKLKLKDRAEFDHETLNKAMEHKSDVPTMGGVLMIVSIGLAMLLLADLGNFYVRMGFVCLFWLGAVGAADDWLKLTAGRRDGSRDGLRMYQKFLFQVGLAVVLGYYIYRHGSANYASLGPLVDPQAVPPYRILSVPFYKPGLSLMLPTFLFLTVLVMAGTSNAVNLTDGMDGLAAGCTAMCALVFMILTDIVGTEAVAHRLLFPYVPQSGELVILCGAILGSCLGFLWYNCHPAHVFMGDTGSLPLGGLIGYVAVVTRQELMLLLAGGVFVIEALSVILQVGYFKWTRGGRLFRCAPIHLHFFLRGWTETQTVVRFWLVAAVAAGFALASIKLR